MEYYETTICNSVQSVQIVDYRIVDEEILVALNTGAIIDIDIDQIEIIQELIKEKKWLTLETRIRAHKR